MDKNIAKIIAEGLNVYFLAYVIVDKVVDGQNIVGHDIKDV